MPEREFIRLPIDDTPYLTKPTAKHLGRKPYVRSDPRRVEAAIPGVIERVLVKQGQKVRRGDGLLVLEAMKMKNDVYARQDAVIAQVHVAAGQMVAKGQILVEFS